MNVERLGTVAVAAMLLIGGVAAVGAASPADQANDSATDAHAGNVPDAADANGTDDANAERADDATDADGDSADAERADGVGPAGGLPEQVPDHVSEIHGTVESFLNGSVDHLGESLRDHLGGGTAADVDDTTDDAGADA